MRSIILQIKFEMYFKNTKWAAMYYFKTDLEKLPDSLSLEPTLTEKNVTVTLTYITVK